MSKVVVSYKFFFARTRILPGKPQDPGNPENAWYAVHPGQQLGNERERSGVYWKPKGAAAERASPSTILPHQIPVMLGGPMPCGGL